MVLVDGKAVSRLAVVRPVVYFRLGRRLEIACFDARLEKFSIF